MQCGSRCQDGTAAASPVEETFAGAIGNDASCTCSASPFMPWRMSVRPTASIPECPREPESSPLQNVQHPSQRSRLDPIADRNPVAQR